MTVQTRVIFEKYTHILCQSLPKFYRATQDLEDEDDHAEV